MNTENYSEYFEYLIPATHFEDIIVKKGEGCWIYDINDEKYMDLNCGQFSAVFGHSDPKLAEVINNMSHTIIHLNTKTVNDELLIAAKNVYDICYDMNGRVIFLSTGSEAVECALRYAKNMSGNKSGVISFDCGYHGLTHGAEGYSISRKWVKPYVSSSYPVTAPKIYDSESAEAIDEYINEFEKTVKDHKEELAAVLMEPIISSGGLLTPPKSYWQRIREICTENNVYLILDECQTGFGRTGTWFYYQQIGCVPDMLISAKAIGCGFPVSMVVFNGNTFPKEKFTLGHFSSHQNEPFAASLVNFGIKEINNNNILESNKAKGKYLVKKLKQIEDRFPNCIELSHGIGMMCGFNLKCDNMERKEAEEQANLFCKIAKKHHLLLQCTNYGRTIRLLPGYNITYKEIDYFLNHLNATLSDFNKIKTQCSS